jgi:hypothetical protein
MLASKNLHLFCFFEKFWTPAVAARQMITKVLEVAKLSGADKHKQKGQYEAIVSRSCK